MTTNLIYGMLEGASELIHKTAKIHDSVKIVGQIANLRIGPRVQIDDFVLINVGSACQIESNVHLASFVSVIGGGQLLVGEFAGLSAGVRVITGSDDYSGDWLTNPTVPLVFRNVSVGSIEIQRHSLIGTNCIIFPGVSIGEGAIVGAGGIVRRDLEPWTVYAGVSSLKAVGRRDRKRVLALEAEYLRSL